MFVQNDHPLGKLSILLESFLPIEIDLYLARFQYHKYDYNTKNPYFSFRGYNQNYPKLLIEY